MRKKIPPSLFVPSKAPSHRQQRVAEEIRHIFSQILLRGEIHDSDLSKYSITVTHVSVSPDLHNALIFVTPLGGKDQEIILKLLIQNASYIRHLVAEKLTLKVAPKIKFAIDHSFDYAEKIETLIKKSGLSSSISDNTDHSDEE
jgi:ribosome-binding factor A